MALKTKRRKGKSAAFVGEPKSQIETIEFRTGNVSVQREDLFYTWFEAMPADLRS